MRPALATVTVVLAAAAGACAAIAGLGDPGDFAPTEAGAGDGNAPPNDGSAPADALADGGTTTDANADADAGRVCTGMVMKKDAFVDRDAAATDGWLGDQSGTGLIEVTNGQLHVRIAAATAGLQTRRHIVFGRPNVKRICVSYTVEVEKPQDTSGYSGAGDTTFGFIHALGVDGGETYHGVMLEQAGPLFYSHGANDVDRPVTLPLSTKWNVFMEADYVADILTIAVNDELETIQTIRPSALPEATLYLGLRNYGPAPESEAFFDDVVIAIDQ